MVYSFGQQATGGIRRAGDAASIFTTVFDGGFDPVPVEAQEGDFACYLPASRATRVDPMTVMRAE